MNVEHVLSVAFSAAFSEVAGYPVEAAAHRSQHADFQVDGALPLARRLGRAPREIAPRSWPASTWPGCTSTMEVSGPGFINLTLDDAVAGAPLRKMAADERLGVPLMRRRRW